jgi:hypothetical protein
MTNDNPIKWIIALSIIGMILCAWMLITAHADTHFVSLTGTNNSPYLNWADSATNIQLAVDASTANDTILLTNGVYYPTNTINVIGKALTFKSVNGRDATILAGGNFRGMFFDLVGGSTIDGFTITNFNRGGVGGTNALKVYNSLFVGNSNAAGGTTLGGGLEMNCNAAGVAVTNCVFSNNFSSGNGGGLFIGNGSGANNPIIYNCLFYGNRSSGSGGGFHLVGWACIVSNCLFVNNYAAQYGGAFQQYAGSGNQITDCLVVSNVASLGGGGVSWFYGSTITMKNCTIISNTASVSGGGFYRINQQGYATIKDCLLAQNSAAVSGGGVWMTNMAIESCTIVSNRATVSGGGLYACDTNCGGTNNIIYFNTAPVAANFTNASGSARFTYNCSTPLITGTGNIAGEPILANLDRGDYRLRGNSPCVNAGLNNTWMTGARDIEGAIRIYYGTVDMGCYEHGANAFVVSGTGVAFSRYVNNGDGTISDSATGLMCKHGGRGGLDKRRQFLFQPCVCRL